MLGACVIATIGILIDSNILFVTAVVLLLFSSARYPQSAPTNYTEKFGPPDPDDEAADPPVTPFTEKQSQDDDSAAP